VRRREFFVLHGNAFDKGGDSNCLAIRVKKMNADIELPENEVGMKLSLFL